MKKKSLALLMAMMMIVGVAIGGTTAYLIAKTEKVENTFTLGKVEITLDEAKVGKDGKKIVGEGAERVNKNSYQLIPGNVYDKDPIVTVKAGSEPCYLYVKVEDNTPNVDFELNLKEINGWKALDGVENVYYREVDASQAAKEFHIIKDDKITVSVDLTAEGMNTATDGVNFTAYAIQKANTGTAVEAWAILNK